MRSMCSEKEKRDGKNNVDIKERSNWSCNVIQLNWFHENQRKEMDNDTGPWKIELLTEYNRLSQIQCKIKMKTIFGSACMTREMKRKKDVYFLVM